MTFAIIHICLAVTQNFCH